MKFINNTEGKLLVGVKTKGQGRRHLWIKTQETLTVDVIEPTEMTNQGLSIFKEEPVEKPEVKEVKSIFARKGRTKIETKMKK